MESASGVVQAAQKTATAAQKKIVETGVGIFEETPSAKDAAFIARELVLASLPHSNPGDRPLWTRRNGHVTLAIQPGMNIQTGKSYGYPYGIIPRLLLFWITTEALRTKNRRLELGNSLSGFMTALGLSSYTGRGKRGDATRLRDQMERLFRSRFSLERYEEDDARAGKSWLDMQVAPQGDLWWSVRAPDQGALWGSWIELGELFYTAMISAPSAGRYAGAPSPQAFTSGARPICLADLSGVPGPSERPTAFRDLDPTAQPYGVTSRKGSLRTPRASNLK